MIERGTCDGQPAVLAYINDDFEPVDKDEATLIVASLEDGRKIIFANERVIAEDAKPWDESKAQRGQPDNAGKFGPGSNSAKQESPAAKSKRATAALAAGRSKATTKRARGKGARTLVEQQTELAALLERARVLQANITTVQQQHGMAQPEHQAAALARRQEFVAQAEQAEREKVARGKAHETAQERSGREKSENERLVARAHAAGRSISEQAEHEMMKPPTRANETPEERTAREIQEDLNHQAMMRESDAEQRANEVAARLRSERDIAEITALQPAVGAALQEQARYLSPEELTARIESIRIVQQLTGVGEPESEELRAFRERVANPPAGEEREKILAEWKAKQFESGKKGEATPKDFEDAGITIRNTYEPGWSPESFVAKWNQHIGMDPKTFKESFTPGLNTTMSIAENGNEFKISGYVNDSNGNEIGTFDRTLKPRDKSAYSAYFKLKKSVQGGDIGKKMLMGNVNTYKALGYDRVAVTANIDIGGYAWAKYGYVPTVDAWDELRTELEVKLRRNRGKAIVQRGEYGGGGESEREAEDWDELDMDQQSETQRQWMRDSRSEYVDSEIESWRENGQPLEDAKKTLVTDWDNGRKRWAEDSLKSWRKDWIDSGMPTPHFNNDQILGALKMSDYSSRHSDGGDDPEFEWDEDFLDATGKDPYQKPLPGIDEKASTKLSEDERDAIIKALTSSFNDRAESDAGDMEAPDYVTENVDEYQEDHWNEMSPRDRLRMAINYGNATITYESDDEDEYADDETENVTLEGPQSVKDQVKELLKNEDPKTLWKVADSPLGKALLIDTSWSGVLEFGDKESNDRFTKYVGRVKGNK
jgi:hypothetical protein